MSRNARACGSALGMNAGMSESMAASTSSSGPYLRLANSIGHGRPRSRFLVGIIEKYQNALHPYDLPEQSGSYRLIMRRIAAAVWCLVALGPTVTAQQPGRTPVGPAGLGWAVDRADLAGNVKFEPHLGRSDAMILRGNTHVVKTGLDFG